MRGEEVWKIRTERQKNSRAWMNKIQKDKWGKYRK